MLNKSFWESRKLRKQLKDLQKAVVYRHACDSDLLSGEENRYLLGLKEEIRQIRTAEPGEICCFLEEHFPKSMR